jgi:hypothetical protein
MLNKKSEGTVTERWRIGEGKAKLHDGKMAFLVAIALPRPL